MSPVRKLALLLPLASAVFVGSAGCSCPTGNAVTTSRDVEAAFQLVTGTGTYSGHASSPPNGRASVPVGRARCFTRAFKGR